jgi:hypothetical protein
MKRFTVLGLCLVAALVFAALSAAGAAAKKSEHGVLDLDAVGGPAHLGTESGSIKSSSNEGSAEITTATSGTAKTLFKGVEVEGFGLKCSSAGKSAGEVETELLNEETGWINKAGGEAGVDFKPHSGEYLAQFACEGLNVKVKGSVIGHTSPNNLENTHGELNLIPDKTPGKTRNSPSNFEGGPEDILRSSFSGLQTGNELESLQQQEGVVITNHGNPSVCKLKKGKEKCKPGQFETNTLAGATPEYGRCIKKKPKGTGKYQEANCATLASEGKGQFEFEPVPN